MADFSHFFNSSVFCGIMAPHIILLTFPEGSKSVSKKVTVAEDMTMGELSKIAQSMLAGAELLQRSHKRADSLHDGCVPQSHKAPQHY